MKKLTALFLAMLMSMALAAPVLAADPPNYTLTYGVTLQEPTIAVTVPTAAQAVILNPYKIKVSNDDIGATNAQGSILSAKFYLVNKSTVPLKMSLTATGSIPEGSGAAFSTSQIASTEKNKKVFLFIDVGSVTEGEAPSTAALCDVTYDATNTKQGVIKVGDLKLTDIMTITLPTNADNGNYVPIQIGGECTTSPTTAWSSADKVGLSIVFSFQAADNVVS